MKFFLRLINSDLRSELKEYRAQFWTPGLVSYRDSGYGVALLKKDTMDKMLPSFLGCPVVIQHKDGSAEEIAASGQAVGKITEALWNPETGWYDCKFTVEDEKALAKIKDGWSVSCAFDSDDTGPAGEWLANKYDFEIVDGHFTHLALVPNPRYEDSKIFANQKCFINSKEASMVKDNAKGKENNKVSGAELKQILGADGWAELFKGGNPTGYVTHRIKGFDVEWHPDTAEWFLGWTNRNEKGNSKKEQVYKELTELGKLGTLGKDYHKFFRRLEATDVDKEFQGMSVSDIADQIVMLEGGAQNSKENAGETTVVTCAVCGKSSIDSKVCKHCGSDDVYSLHPMNAAEVKCRYCGRPSEDRSGVCDACERKYENSSFGHCECNGCENCRREKTLKGGQCATEARMKCGQTLLCHSCAESRKKDGFEPTKLNDHPKQNDAFGPNIIRVTFRTKRGSTEDKYKLTEEFSSEANARLRASALNWDIISSEQIKQNAKVKLYMKMNAEKCTGKDHNPNPGKIVSGGALCVECGGFIADEKKNAAAEERCPKCKKTVSTHLDKGAAATYTICDSCGETIREKRNAALKCPGCGGTNIQKAEGYKLNKCLSCHLAFDTAEENAKKNAEGWVPQFKAWLKTVGDANGKDYATMEKMWEKHAQMNYDQSPTTFEFLEWNKLKGPQYNSKENGMRGWDVYLRGKLIDTVFYDDSCDADYVKRGLIDHDGYDPAIEIKGGKKNERKQNSVRMRIVRA